MNSAAQKIKVCLVGAGQWGRQHARVFSQRSDVTLCAVAKRTLEKTQARGTDFGLRAYTNVSQMLDTEKPDLVSLSLPNQEHFEATMQVIKSGYPLFVEKPLTFDLSEADQLLAEAEKRGLFFAINFNHRYARPLRLARDAIHKGRLGDLTHAIWRFGGEANVSLHPYANLIETQCHGFDQLEELCGPIDSVMAEMTNKTGGGYRTMAVALRFESGAIGSMAGTYDSSYAYKDTHRLEINGTEEGWSSRIPSNGFVFRTPAARPLRFRRQAISTISIGNFTALLMYIWTRYCRLSNAAMNHRYTHVPVGAPYN